ncbi:MAG: helix-hairpin-helix domain-containing protein [Propionibacterium sp.]|nr:helix-hairpin-helix domain-containing protein [Propionibacterium sp.]
MRYRHDADAAQLARARLAYVSAGHRPLTAPRRALPRPDDDGADEVVPEEIPAPSGAPPPAPAPTAKLPAPFTRTHLIAIGVVLLVVAVALGITWTRASAEVIPTVPVVESEAPVVEEPVAPPESEVPISIRVHVLGSVAAPGVVMLDGGAIVADAIAAAGGLSADAVPGDLNLASAVTDGMQIKVGSAQVDSHVEGAPPPGPAGGGGGGDAVKINLNTASAVQLEELPGVGPVMAAAIVAWRDQHGTFTSVSELQEISGIGPKTFQKLEPLVTV